MIDYHLHGNFCGHASGELEEYVLSAQQRGFEEIGFSAHLPKVIDPDPYHAMLEEDLPRYVDLVLSLRERYRERLSIKLGIEADYFAEHEEKTARLLESFPFDYVLGSVHFLDDWHFTSRVGLPRYETEDPDEVFPRYYQLLKRMISSGLFDIAAHADAIRREHFMSSKSLDQEYKDVARLLADKKMSIEVSTAGIRRGAGSIYPDRGLLEACIEAGVGVTLGSDAHRPEEVGRDYEEALNELQSLGVTQIATYERRKATLKPLPHLNES
jgi:histidinol-phosphatase (PHP family)